MAVDPNLKRVKIRYLAEDGIHYAIATSHAHAQAVGATAALDADPAFPRKWKPRVVDCVQILGGRDRKLRVVVPDKASALWRATTNTINVQPYGNLRVTGRSGERRTQGAPGFNGTQTPYNEFVSIKYHSDNGNDYSLVVSRAHAYAVGATSGAGFPQFPKRWTPRHYGALNPDLAGADQKVVLVEGDPNSAAWMSDASFGFNVKGVTFQSTGRKQESRPETAPGYVP